MRAGLIQDRISSLVHKQSSKYWHRGSFSFLPSKQWQSVFVFLEQPPAGFSPKARSRLDLSCHSSYGSLPREVRDQTPPATEGSPIHGYTSIEVTNVWGQQSCEKHLASASDRTTSRTSGFSGFAFFLWGWTFTGQRALFKWYRVLNTRITRIKRWKTKWLFF